MNGSPGRLRRLLPPAMVFVAGVIAWDLYVRLGHLPGYLLPGPAAVWHSLRKMGSNGLLESLGWTALGTLLGFAASAIVGVMIAVALAGSPMLRRALYPYTVFFQTVPIVAIAPMLIFWVDFGLWPVVICAFIVSVFPVIANTLAGLMSTDPALVDLFRLYGSSPFSALWKLRLPFALPNIFSGLRIAGGLAVIGTVVAELQVGKLVEASGLGVRVVSGIKNGEMAVAFAAVVLASLLGLTMFAAINLAAHLAMRRWHASEQ